MKATYSSKDQNWQSESTCYWFDVDGEMYGVVHRGPEVFVVDCDGCPVNIEDAKNAQLKSLSDSVTEEMILD